MTPDRTCPHCGHRTLMFNDRNGQRFCTRATSGWCTYIGLVTVR